ncbi:MAG TPA: CYTH domain-containing protein [Frateuria sp.]|uniref:CYTH domain-containing protein n=1 Tax=Frateuria sp. TaxID=2211372 RepID=UPI002DEC0C69|nr:CYTH domain-containing protein [Frateuria sp.]
MATEIERKFLLADERWRQGVVRSERIAQGYLVGARALQEGQALASVRVRRAGERAWLNVKSATLGIERAEFEYPVPLEDAQAMLASLCDGVLEKVRHYVEVEGSLFEVDEFLGDNAGLVVAEIELPAADAAFPRPAWLGREVSALARYYNVNLVAHPFARWSDAERAGADGEPTCC